MTKLSISKTEIKESFGKRQLIADKFLQDKSAFLNGLSKVRNYLLQDSPTSNSLPVFLIPYTDDLKSLFSFMIKCTKEDNFKCESCWSRNECLRKCLYRVQMAIAKRNKRLISIGDILSNIDNYRTTAYCKEAAILLSKIITNLGEVK